MALQIPGFTQANNDNPIYEDKTTQNQFSGGLSADGYLTFWGDDPDAWDEIWFSGKKFPGLVRLTCKPRQRRDKKRSPGKTGQRATHLGYEATPIHVEAKLWTPAQWRDFQDMARQLRPPPGKKPPEPVAVFHPALAAIGITEVEVVGISPPEPTGEPGVMKIELELEEFVYAPAKVNTPTAANLVRPNVQEDMVNRQNAQARASNSGASDPSVRNQ